MAAEALAATKKAKAETKSQRVEDRLRLQKLRSEGLTEDTWEDGTVEVMPLKRAGQLWGAKGKEHGAKGKDHGDTGKEDGGKGKEHGDK